MITPKKLIKKSLKSAHPTIKAFRLSEAYFTSNPELYGICKAILAVYLTEHYQVHSSSYQDFVRQTERSIVDVPYQQN
jgi:hypothetical protein